MVYRGKTAKQRSRSSGEIDTYNMGKQQQGQQCT